MQQSLPTTQTANDQDKWTQTYSATQPTNLMLFGAATCWVAVNVYKAALSQGLGQLGNV